MPFLEGPFAFTGKLDMLSAYRMRGVDGIVVRRKGGPSGEKVKTAANFKNTRHTMSEFGGCSRHGSYVRKALLQIRHLADYNFGSDINSVMRQVQLRDGTGEWGRRRITLSEHTRLLEGFSTTRKAPAFDSIVRAPIYYTLDRKTRSARVDLPELLRDINYFPQNNHAMFRLTVTLGIVPDVTYDVPSKEYLPPKWYSRAYNSISTSTDWNPSLEGMEGTTLELAMGVALPPDDAWTLMLSIGIEYGAFRRHGEIGEVPRFGAAKIMALQGKDGASGEDDGSGGIGEDEAPAVDLATAPESVPSIAVESEQDGVQYPEVRYVYTMKETVVKKQETRIYSYAVSVSVQSRTSCKEEYGSYKLPTGQALPIAIEITASLRPDSYRVAPARRPPGQTWSLPDHNFLHLDDCLRMDNVPLCVDHRHRSRTSQRIGTVIRIHTSGVRIPAEARWGRALHHEIKTNRTG